MRKKQCMAAIDEHVYKQVKDLAIDEQRSIRVVMERLILRGLEAEMLDWAEKNMIDDDLRSAA